MNCCQCMMSAAMRLPFGLAVIVPGVPRLLMMTLRYLFSHLLLYYVKYFMFIFQKCISYTMWDDHEQISSIHWLEPSNSYLQYLPWGIG